jgi:ATP-dependent DNA ligase
MTPMLARLVRELPTGGWTYEPKWDGFRCLAFRTTDELVLQSRNLRPLGRYFPDVAEALQALPAGTVLDGELLVPGSGDYAFTDLMARIHPSASRVAALAAEQQAAYVAFDCLARGDGDLTAGPFEQRRAALEHVHAAVPDAFDLTPLTADPELALQWYAAPRPGWDGIVAKDPTAPYQPGKRAMAKLKPERTADCVVAGIRLGATGRVASLLLGLWGPDATLHHPGVVTSPPAAVKAEAGRELASLVVRLEEHPWRNGFGLEGGATGRLKGAGSRWLPGMSLDWIPVAPVRVAEVAYDRVDGVRFRHPARWRRWRPDRDPQTCLVDQLVSGR